MVAALVARLSAAGHDVHVVIQSRARSHGRERPHKVDPAADGHREVGDEALLLAALAPVWVARDRASGARAAAEAGAALILLDGGLQDPALAHDGTILMVDAATGFGNGCMVPAGPLREPLADGLARAAAVVLVGTTAERTAAVENWPELAAALPARLIPRETGLPLVGETLVVFAGIGRPERFFATLKAMGAKIAAAVPFPDNYDYPPAVLRRLNRDALAAGAMLVTTERDAARLPESFRREVVVVQMQMVPGDEDAGVKEGWAALDQAFAKLGVEMPHLPSS